MKDASLANLRPENALVHGVRAADGLLMRCDRCPVKGGCEEFGEGALCEPERRYIAERRAQLEALEWVDPVIDGPALSVLVWQEVRITRAARYLAATGELLPGAEHGYAEYVPLADKINTLVNSWQRHLQALGLTPPARRAMEAKGEAGPAAQIAAAIRALSRSEGEQAEPVDAEFTTEEGSVENGE